MADVHLRNTDLDLLHPSFRTNLDAVLSDLQGAGLSFRVFEAYRYPERQADLYAKGRTAPGGIVTYAEPWRSYHQFGLAADFVLYENNAWSWDTKGANAAKWKQFREIGSKHGLAALQFELPHLQLAGTSSNALSHGIYPADGSDTWAENLQAAIAAWQGTPAAPPPPAVPERPALA